MAYDSTPEAARDVLFQAGFAAETILAIEAALGGRFASLGEPGSPDGAMARATGAVFADPGGDHPVIVFDTDAGASFAAPEGETLSRFIAGTNAGDSFATAGGDDDLTLGRGHDRADAGGGIDVVTVNGRYSPDKITVNADGSITIDNGADGIKTLRNTEIVQFEDVKVVVTDDVDAGTIALLYEAAFGRQIDNAGYRFWTRAATDAGLSVERVAQQFAESGEFRGRFGDLDDEAFVGAIYANFFDREGDAEGSRFWVDLLAGGEITRGDFLKGVAGSQEAFERFEEVVRVLGVDAGDDTDNSGEIG